MHFWFDAVGHSLGSSFEPVSLPYERNGRFIAGISSARVSQTGRVRPAVQRGRNRATSADRG